MDFQSAVTESKEDLRWRPYFAQDVARPRGSTQPSVIHGGCFTPDYDVRGEVEHARPGSIATTWEDMGRDEGEHMRKPLELALVDTGPHPTPTFLASEASSVTNDRRFLHSPLRIGPQSSIGFDAVQNLLDETDKHIHFVAEFRKLERQRRKVEVLRVHARDRRSHMKATRAQLHRAIQTVIGAGGPRPLSPSSLITMTSNLQEVEMASRNSILRISPWMPWRAILFQRSGV